MRAVEPLIKEDPNAYLILSQAAFRASWADNPITGLKRGESFLGHTDFPSLTRGQYREATKRIPNYGFAAVRTTTKGTIVSLDGGGFAEFAERPTTDQATIEQPSNNHPTTTNKELRIKNKEKNIPPPLAEVVGYFESKRKSVAMANEFFDHYESNGWRVGKNLMKKWKNAASGWIARQGEYGGRQEPEPVAKPRIKATHEYHADGTVSELVESLRP